MSDDVQIAYCDRCGSGPDDGVEVGAGGLCGPCTEDEF